jgi:two-component system, sporulation sensor kinase E
MPEHDKNSLRLSLLLEHLEDAVLVEDDKRNIMYANRAFGELFGMPDPSTLVNTNCAEAFKLSAGIFKDSKEALTRITEILNDRAAVYREEIHLKDGRTLERNYIPVNEQKNQYGNMWVYRDITPHVSKATQLSGTLAESEKLNRLMTDRELKMIEMKKEIKELRNKLSEK